MTNDPSYIPPRIDYELVLSDARKATQINFILDRAHREIAELEFGLGWPVPGYDQDSTLEMLRDMSAPTTVRAQIYARAEEKAFAG